MDELTGEDLDVFAGYEDLMRECAEEERKSCENSNRILDKLRRTLRSKIWEPIEWELKSHYCLALGIVPRSKVKGRKESGHDYFGQSTAIRHVYVDVSSCSYSDSYVGDVYIRLSKDRYLMMFIHG